MSRATKVFGGLTLFLFLILLGCLGEIAQNGRYAIKAYKDYYVIIDTRRGKAEKRFYEKQAQADSEDLDTPMSLVDAYLDGY